MYNTFRHLRILYWVVPAALLSCTPACNQLNSVKTIFQTHHDAAASEIVLPFPAPPVRAKGSVYRDPLFGLKLDAVVADGEPVQGEESMVLIDDIDLHAVPVNGDAYIYLVTTGEPAPSVDGWCILAASAVTEDNFDLEEFTIPRGTQRLQIRYRVRDPEGNGLGPSLMWESIASGH